MKININKYGEGFPIVFFHGWGFDSRVWLPLIPRLLPHYQLILIDLPGFGYTPVMDWFFFKEHLLSQLPEQFALIGWSMGGVYALRLAIENPDRVSYLINVASSPRFLLDKSWPGVSMDVFKKFHQELVRDPKAILNDFLKLQGLSINERLNYVPNKLPSSEGLALGLNVLETWDFREELKHLAQSSFFIFGRLDPIVPVNVMQCMQHAYPQFNYALFNRAAHMPFLSHSDLFIEEIQRFIQ